VKNLPALLAHLEKTRARVISASDGIPVNRWRESPGPAAWSASEVVAHLAMVEPFVINILKQLLETPPISLPLLKRFHKPIRLAEWRIFKRKTPVPLDPHLVVERPASVEKLAATRRETLGFINDTRSRDLNAYRFPHPFLGSFTIYNWLVFLGYHELRHAKQIRKIVETFQG
jgi:hypothetical protein